MSAHRDEEFIEERTPLLRNKSHSISRAQQSKSYWNLGYIPIHRVKQAVLVPIVGSLAVFFNEAEFYIKQPAQIRAIESMACFEYYAKLNDPIAKHGIHIPELMCKGHAVQERVASLYGVLHALRQFSAVLGTLWMLYWFKAGRRRPVLILHKANLLLSNSIMLIAYFGFPKIPIWFICLNGLTGIIGGNLELGNSVLFSAYADVIPDPTRRSTLIFITMSLQYAAQAICLPITGRLMSLHGTGTTPEVSFFVATACSITAVSLLVFLFPETFQPEQTEEETQADQTARTDRGAVSNPSSKHSVNPYQLLLKEIGLFRVALLLMANFLAITSTRIIDWYGLLQYPSVKFHWSFSTTTYLITLQAVLSFLNFAFLLPAVNKLCKQKFNLSQRATSIGIIIGSIPILTLSTIFFGLPDTTPSIFIGMTVVFTLGSGVNSALQTYLVNISSSTRSSAAVLTVVSIGGTLGKFAASAIWPATLALGLELAGGRLAGLPFFVAAVMFVLLGVTVSMADHAKKWKA